MTRALWRPVCDLINQISGLLSKLRESEGIECVRNGHIEKACDLYCESLYYDFNDVDARSRLLYVMDLNNDLIKNVGKCQV